MAAVDRHSIPLTPGPTQRTTHIEVTRLQLSLTPGPTQRTTHIEVTRHSFLPASVFASTLLYYRAYDTGTANFVYWQSYTENLTPVASLTTPNYTGTLQHPHIWLKR